MTLDRFAGTPCWIDLPTPNAAAATRFYGAVLGWTFDGDVDGGGYIMAKAGDAVVAGIGPLSPESIEDVTPRWGVYLHTPDVAAAVARVQAAGTDAVVLVEPRQLGPFGSMAQLRDPWGAVVQLWQPGRHPGFTAMGPPGTPVWFEVNTRQSEGVRDFFAELFDLTHEKMGEMQYFTLHAGGRPRYGVLQMDEQWDGMDPHWMVYFSVEDTDASAEVVRAEGGTVAHGPFDTPFGRIAICKDPTGAAFTLIKPADAG